MNRSRISRRSPAALAALAGLALACSIDVPVQLPPPFDVSGGQQNGQARLLLPTGITASPSGHLLVVSSNLDRLYDAGTLLAFSPAWTASMFEGPATSIVTADALPRAPDVWAAMIPDYAGPVALDEPGRTAWVGSRTTNLATGANLDAASGRLTCAVGGGDDCRAGTFNTKTSVKLEGPFGVVAGRARVPGDPTEHSVVFISSLVPHIDEVVNNQIFTYGRVAAVLADEPTRVLFTIDASGPTVANGIGAGTIIYDRARSQVILGGCYMRFSASASGDPATTKCGLNRTNPIRFVDVASGSQGAVRTFDLAPALNPQVPIGETIALVLGGEDAAGVPQTLYALSRSPDVLVEIALPAIPGQDPVVRRTVALPLQPSHAIRIAKPAGAPPGDLIAVAGGGNGTLTVYDASIGQVVAQVNGLGDYPAQLTQLPQLPGADRARLVATVFGSCRLAFVDVDTRNPSDARLRALIGKCR